MKKICIVNAHWSNRGDEAALRAIIDAIGKSQKDYQIRVCFKDNQMVQQFPYTDPVLCFSAKFLPHHVFEILVAVITKGKICADRCMKQEIKALCNQDLIIYAPGGSVISDRFWWRKQLEYLVPFFCAKHYRIPMVMAAPSVGPFQKHNWRNFIRKKLLQVPKHLFVREEISKEYLYRLGISKNVAVTIDTAFYDTPDMEANEVILKENLELQAFLNRYPKVIGMTISDFSWHVKYLHNKLLSDHIRHVMKDFISNQNKEGIGILLIPQLFGNQNDIKFLKQFEFANTFVLADTFDTYFQQFLISKLYAVVGMRYHSNIFAAKMGIPFLAIPYEEKMQGFLQQWGLNQYSLQLEELSVPCLKAKWEILRLNYSSYQLYLQKHREIWRKQAAQTIRAIVKNLEK